MTLSQQPSAEELLSILYHSLPDILPAVVVDRFNRTGVWAEGSHYAKRGFTSKVVYRLDDDIHIVL